MTVHYDTLTDSVIVTDKQTIRYSGDLFRALETQTPPGKAWRTLQSEPGQVIVQMISIKED